VKQVLIAVCAALACVPAWAQAPADFAVVDTNLKACLARHGDTPGVDNCNGVAKAAADRRLNVVYAGLVSALKHPGDPIEVRDDPEILRRLVASERAWIVFRDAECSYHSSYMLHGTGEDDADTACLYEQTKTRVKALTAPDAPQNLR
jgi:uncharacterized protein YecT (DUF1311 family)